MSVRMLGRYFAICFMLAAPADGFGADLATPAGRPVLTISGNISRTNGDGVAAFDIAMLEALPSHTIQTTTIWTDGVQTLTGVPLKALLDEVGAAGRTLRATAINDYAIEIPMSDAVEGGPVVSYLRNGALMPVRDKGPLWIVYPYDDDPAFRTEVIYSRSIWQLNRIEVVD